MNPNYLSHLNALAQYRSKAAACRLKAQNSYGYSQVGKDFTAAAQAYSLLADYHETEMKKYEPKPD